MLTPAAKRRRRAEAASATLARPFRTPVTKRGPATDINTPSTEPSEAARRTTLPSSPERRHKQPQQHRPADSPESLSLGDLVDQFSRALDAGDKQVHILQAERNVQETAGAEAASASRKSSRSKHSEADELPVLIARWRTAARLAAEEVFGLVSERVAREGGAKAWRAMMASGETADARKRPSSEEDSDNDGKAEREDDSSGVSLHGSHSIPPALRTTDREGLYNDHDAGELAH